MARTWKLAGVNFDHMHMGDNLRMAAEHPRVEIVGLADRDPERMEEARRALGVADDRLYTDERDLLTERTPDIVILCPATAEHAEWTERIAPYGPHILMEKPLAASVAEGDRMIAAMAATGRKLAINWPLRWYPPHVTTKRLVDEGAIGDVIEVHYYDGNRGPLFHGADKVELEPTRETKAGSWFYSREQGGGSLLDYLGYGTTLATWFNGGQEPLEVTAVTDDPEGLEVDEHSITVVRYARGLSKFETRWGTFTDPWTHQPQPKCGFVLVGSEGTISSYDYESTVRLQTRDAPEGRELPVDEPRPPFQNPVQYLVHLLDHDLPVEGPLDPAVCRTGQRIVDAAVTSAREGRTVRLQETA